MLPLLLKVPPLPMRPHTPAPPPDRRPVDLDAKGCPLDLGKRRGTGLGWAATLRGLAARRTAPVPPRPAPARRDDPGLRNPHPR